MRKYLIIPLLLVFFFVSGCDGEKSAKDVANDFWQAVIDNDMESAKQFATWDTVEYLKYLSSTKTHPERFELGEEMLGEKTAEISVILHTKATGKESVRIPGKTILVKTEEGWRVDVKKSLGTVVKQTVNNVFDQLNNMMQQGIKELDKSFSESMGEIGRSLEEGAQELQRELDKTLPSPSSVPKPEEI